MEYIYFNQYFLNLKPFNIFDMIVKKAKIKDLDEILQLQLLAYQSEAEIYNDFTIPPLHQTFDDLKDEYPSRIMLKAIENGRIIGSVRAYEERGTCFIGKLIVHPDHQNMGIGTELMRSIESRCKNWTRFELFTGERSEKNLHLYKKWVIPFLRQND